MVLSHLRRIAFTFTAPKHCDLLLFDGVLPNVHKRIILRDFEYASLDFRVGQAGVPMCFAAPVLARLIRRSFRPSPVAGWGWKKRLVFAYFAAMVEHIAPKVVISLRGGLNLWFGALARAFPGTRFLAVAPSQVHDVYRNGMATSSA